MGKATMVMQNEAVFGNDRIMYKILCKLPFYSLLSSRLVSKQWNVNILCLPTFNLACLVNVQTENPDQVLKTFTLTGFNQWRNFKFNSKGLNNVSEAQVRFWQKKGWQIRSLIFQNHSLGPITFLEILLSCPNLQDLKFSCKKMYKAMRPMSDSEDEDGEVTPAAAQKLIPHLGMMREVGVLRRLRSLVITESNFMPPEILRDFLQWSSNLKELTLTDTNNNFPFPGWDIRSVIDMADQQRKCLTRLDLSGPHICPEHIVALGKIPDLCLRFVSFRFAQVTDRALTYFFRTQKYLEGIDLSFTEVTEKAFAQPQCTFQKVKKLNLAGFSNSLEFLSFLSRMPNLEHINLSNSRSTSMSWENLLAGFLPAKLKKLECLDLSHNMPLGTFQQQNIFQSLSVCQRQITCLNLSGNPSIKDSLLNIIWWNLRSLKVLYLEHMANITNEGLTGIRHGQLQGAEKSGKLDTLDPSLLRYQHKNSPFIGLCQHIHTLSLAFCPRLTDLAIQFGIRFLPNLQNLKLTGLTRISDRSMHYLGTGCFSLSMLDVSGTAINPHWVNWAKFCLPRLRQVLVTHPPPPDVKELEVPPAIRQEFNRINETKLSSENEGNRNSENWEETNANAMGLVHAGGGGERFDRNNNIIV